jgi:hypothetical protein
MHLKIAFPNTLRCAAALCNYNALCTSMLMYSLQAKFVHLKPSYQAPHAVWTSRHAFVQPALQLEV